MLFQKPVRLAEGPAPKEAVMSRQGAGMRRLQDQMIGIVQHLLLHLGRSAPQNEHNGPVLLVQRQNSRIRKFLPSLPPVGIGHMRPHRP